MYSLLDGLFIDSSGTTLVMPAAVNSPRPLQVTVGSGCCCCSGKH